MKFILNILIILFITPTIAEDRKSVISSIDNDKIIISKQYFDKNVFLYCKVQEYIEFKDNVIVASYLRSQISNASAIDGFLKFNSKKNIIETNLYTPTKGHRIQKGDN